MSPPAVVAVIDHDPAFLAMMGDFLGGEGYEPACFLADDRAFARLRALDPALAIIDISVHRRAACLALIEDVRTHAATRHIPVVVVTADIAWSRAHGPAIAAHGCALVEKPFTLDDLLACIERLIAAVPPTD